MTATTAAQGDRSVALAGVAGHDAAASRSGRRRRDNLVGWGFVAPFLVFFVLFLIWPILFGIYLSFTDQSLAGTGGNLVGFANYAEALSDPIMWRSFGNTVWFTVVSTVPLVLIALIMALLVDQGLPGQWLWRLSFFMPFLLASTVASQIWVWIYNPQLGIANAVIGALGMEPVAWLQDADTALYAIIVQTVWWTIGFNFLLYLAALQNIPPQHYEAASIDGAGKWRQLWSITLPQLGPTTVLIVILQILASLKLFDQVYQMLGGVSSPTTRSVVLYIFESGFTGYRFGYSAAISYVFFAIIIIISVAQYPITRRRRAS
ncbi:carbohydrate ABC transporter permease [Naasia sp. SYSU D00057]|uniref:carbohydrate ABC transporter permease n=1 Tax=Naasia sp. SYSU D00057 TaxID=2817380 RepID=UPI001B3092BE|nr:sugar ABC transporter permease [Naasia sp. SYSU D00057]